MLKILLIVIRQLVEVCSFKLKPHLYFHISTVPEPQQKAQQTEQVEVLPDPGEIWYTATKYHDELSADLQCHVSVPSLRALCFEDMTDFDVNARVCSADSQQEIRSAPFLVLNKQIHILKTWSELNFQTTPHVEHTVYLNITSLLNNSVSTNCARSAKQQVLCV